MEQIGHRFFWFAKMLWCFLLHLTILWWKKRTLVKKKSGAWSASDLYTYKWPADSDILSNKSLPAQIYFNSNTHKKMDTSFRVNNDSTILNRALKFPIALVWTETHMFWMFISYKNDDNLSIVNVTRLYMIDHRRHENQTGAEWHNASLCSDLSTNKSLH